MGETVDNSEASEVEHAGLIPVEQEISGEMTDEEIDALWGLGPAPEALDNLLKMDLSRVQGAGRLGTLARAAGQTAAAETLELLSKADRANADGLRLIGRGSFGR